MSERKHHHALRPGYKLHWYEIREILGRGGFGITYLAQDTNLNRLVAIKEYMPIELANRDSTDSVKPLDEDDRDEYQWGLERFISEAQTLAQFEHPNIVRVIAVFEENNTGYMVMNYEEGEELQEILKRRKVLDETELLNALLPLLEGLEKIHDAGFIHRDIKPQNILIRPDGSPLLIDFGSARQALGGKTRTLTSLVTPGYAPFEQYHTKSDKQGPWTDIYSLAATLYRCILGRSPMSSIDRSESIFHGTGDIFISAREIGEGRYSKVFLNAIDHGLKFKPEDRPQSIKEWKQDLVKIKLPKKQNQRNESKIATRRAGSKGIPGQQVEQAHRSKTQIFVASILICLAIPGFYFYEDIKDTFIETEEIPADAGPSTIELLELEKARVTALEVELDKRNEQLNKLLEIDLPSANELAKKEKGKVFALETELENSRNQLAVLEHKAEEERRIAGEIARKEQERKLAEEQARQRQLEKERRLAEEQARQEKERKLAEDKARQKQLEKEQMVRQVEALLTAAKKDIKEMNLMTPDENNAYSKYKQVLEINPEDKEAKAGIESIANQLVVLANKEIKSGDLARADTLLASAEKIASETGNITKARILLKAKQEEKLNLLAEEEAENQKLAEVQKQKEEISKLLALAKKDIEAQRLTSPSGSNALERYQRVLVLEPGNPDALLGQQVIVSRYIELAEQAMAIKDFEKSFLRLEKAEKITPGAENIQFAREKITLQQEALVNEQKAREQSVKTESQQTQIEEKQLEAQQKKLAEEETARQQAEKERLRLQAEIEKLQKQTNTLKQSSTTQLTPAALTIAFNIKGTDQRDFNKIGLDGSQLSNEVSSILSKAGYNVVNSGSGLNSNTEMVMDLIFKPHVSSGSLWDWRTSVEVKSLSRGKIWERYIQLADTGKRRSQHVFDLKPAYDAFVDSVKSFVSENKIHVENKPMTTPVANAGSAQRLSEIEIERIIEKRVSERLLDSRSLKDIERVKITYKIPENTIFRINENKINTLVSNKLEKNNIEVVSDQGDGIANFELDYEIINPTGHTLEFRAKANVYKNINGTPENVWTRQFNGSWMHREIQVEQAFLEKLGITLDWFIKQRESE